MATLLQSTTIGGHSAIHAGNIGSQSVNYANSAGSTAWTNVSGRPTALSQFTNDLGNYGNWITSSALANYLTTSQVTSSMISGLNNMLGVTSLPYSVDITVDGDPDRFYAVQFWGGDQDVWRRIIIKRGYSEPAPWDPIGTGVHHGGLLLDWEGNFGGWGGAEYADRLRVFNESYTNVCADMFIWSHSMGYVFMLRGGGAVYHLHSDQAINGFYQSGSPDILYSTSTLSYDDAWSGTNQYDVPAPAPLSLGQVNSTRIDGLRTKKQSLLDGRYFRQGIDISGITNVSSTNFLASNAFYLNGTAYFLNSTNGGIYTNARFESGTLIVAPGGNSSQWNTAHGWGNHASVGYLTSLPSHNHDGVYIPINPDGDGPSWQYSDANPTINGTSVGGRQSFGADGDALTGGALQARLLNAYDGHVNSAYGYYVGNLNYGGDSGTHSTTQVIDSSGRWVGPAISDMYISSASTWNTAYGWGNHASADYIVRGTQIASSAPWTTATRFGSVGDISQNAGNHALSVRSEDGNDAFMSFHIGSDYAVHFGLDRVSNRMHVGGWSDGAVKYQLWDSRDFTSTNVSNWNTAYSWGNHASYSYATTSYVTTQINNLIAGAPGALDTLSELATALGNDASFATTVTNSIATKLPLAGGTMSGRLTLKSISGVEQTVPNDFGAYLHLGDWGVGRTDPGAVLVNTAYRADYATDLFDMNISRFTNNSGYITNNVSGHLTLSQALKDTSNVRMFMPGGGSYVTQTSVITGAIRIKLPTQGSGMMMTCTVKVYEYSANKSFTITFGGHRDGANWYSEFCYIDGDKTRGDLTVRFGVSGGKDCVWIGETNSSWSYPQVFVTDFQLGYSGYSATWATGWEVAFATAFDTINRTQTAHTKITTSNIGSQSVSYAATAGSAPNAGNINQFYDVTAGVGNGLRFWNGSESYKISMGVGALYQYGPVTDYSIKMQMNNGDTVRGFTWGRESHAPIAALNSTSGDMQIAGSFTTTSVNAPSGYVSNGNPWGTANSAYFPNGITTAGSDNWIYGHTYVGNAPGNGNGHEFWADGNMRSTGHHYLDANYGQTIVGRYSSTVYQGVWAMGDSYKLPMNGSTTGSLYGLAWSHPNAGGVAGNLNTHGLLVMENGTFLAAVSGSIRARDDMRAPYFYGSGSIRLGDMWDGAGLYRPSGSMVFGIEDSDWVFSKGAATQAYFAGDDGNLWMRWAGDWLSNLLGAKQNNLGFTPYNATNPAGYITGISFANVSAKPTTLSGYGITDALGYISFTDSVGLNDNKLYLRTKGDNNHYIWNAADDWEEIVAYNGTGLRISTSTGTTLATFSASGNSMDITGNAATATNVAWTGVTSRPTALSQFTNDLGNYGGWITGVTNISGYSGSVNIPDWRNTSYTPAQYDGNRVNWHFNNTDYNDGPLGDYWGAMQTVSPWSQFHTSHRQSQLWWGGSGGLSYRYAVGSGYTPTGWSAWEKIITSGNIASQSVASATSASYADSIYFNGVQKLYGGSDGTRNTGWAYHNNNGTGLHWPNNGWHIYPVNASDMYIRSGASDCSLKFTKSGESGSYIHCSAANEIGFLTTARDWSLKVDNSGNAFATTSFRAPIFYDSADTAYYGDFASTSRMNAIVYDNLYFSGNQAYGFIGTNVYADTINGRGSDSLELNYYDGGSVIIGTGVNGSKPLYAGSLYDAGNRVYSAANPQVNISGNAATASSVEWGNVSSKPASWLNAGALVGEIAPSATAFPSGFYQSYLGAGNPTGTWFNYINVRHSNTNNGHGYQLGMSYYDNILWFRSYQGGLEPSFQSWAYAISSQNIASQSVANAVTVGGYSPSNFLGKNGNSYYQADTWIQMNGTHGLYWPDYYGGHFHANDLSSYTQFAFRGSKNSYGGFYDYYSRVNGAMYDSSGNGGVYREANGLWYWYYHVGNNSMGIGGSTNSSSYVVYANGSIYATGDIVAYSDRRKKTDIVTIDSALDKVMAMRGVFYTKIDESDKGRQVGVIAQEVNEILPEAVTYAADVDEYGVKYGNIVGVLIEAIKEQQKEIDELKAKLN